MKKAAHTRSSSTRSRQHPPANSGSERKSVTRLLGMKRSSLKSVHRGRRLLSFWRVKLLFEDDELIVVEKPCGLLTIATEKERSKTLYAALFDYVKHKRPPEKIFIVHRLDRDVSGLLV